MGPGDFADVDVGAGVDAHAVGGDELSGIEAFALVAQAGDDVPRGVVDADAGAQPGGGQVGADGSARVRQRRPARFPG